ncbi:MAG: cyclic nucleotide-binding domain-containing protein [Proteobacteria bacterium]|nr:cyclic nucleotide-binding domain-containing protein [Pseudomonadota bacterium]MCP4919339.1 cyclic nucleotide-binding domain-containing protein [Pseudomonadota bacterium]
MLELTDCALFRGMDDATAQAIAKVFLRKTVEFDEVLFRQGAEGNSLVVILEGLFELVQEADGGELHLADVQPGRVLGLTSLIDPGPRTATLRAMEDGQVAVLDRATFNQLWQAEGDAAARLHFQIALIAIEEVRSANRKLIELLDAPLHERVPEHVGPLLTVLDSRIYQAGSFS